MRRNSVRGLLAVSSIVLLSGVAVWLAPDALAQQGAEVASLAADDRVLTSKGAWAAGVTYKIDDVVTSRGSTWRSKKNANKGNVPGASAPASTAARASRSLAFVSIGGGL